MATMPDAAQPLERVAFGSCIDQSAAQPIWDAVRAARPQLMLFGGDNVYASMPPWSLQALQAAYAQQAAQPGFVRLRREVPAMATWDDNDYGRNDGDASFEHKQASKTAFLNFWREPPDSDRRFREGVYTARSLGPPGRRVQVILLDTRWFRSPFKPSPTRGAPGAERYVPDDDPGKTLLGERQWRWLESRLREDADLRLIVSSIQVVVDGHGWERWGNLPLERQRLYDLIARTRARGVVLLSGDRHLGALYRQSAGTAYPLHELTASGFTHTYEQAAEAGPNRLGALVTALHFGLIEVDWATRAVQLELRGEHNQLLQQQRVPLAELQSR
jgi:alkaline phosphatase D